MSDPVFLGRQANAEEARFHVIQAPIEDGAPLQKGQSAAPAAILAASARIDPYDEEIARCPSDEAPVLTVAPPEMQTVEAVQLQVEAAIDAVAAPVILGGDPSISMAGIQALSEKSEEFTILHVTAHAHCKNDGAMAETVMRRAMQLKNCRKIVQVGVLALSGGESENIFSEDETIEAFFACDLAKHNDEGWHEDVIQELSTPVYLSIDLAGLSRSIVPSVGVPEPGGIDWWPLLRLLKDVTKRRRIAAVDVVDLIPLEGDVTGDYAAARLIHKVMAYMVVSGKMLAPEDLEMDEEEEEEGEEA
ncbi:MAG: arginase family protein [Planctomycetota bacterium]